MCAGRGAGDAEAAHDAEDQEEVDDLPAGPEHEFQRGAGRVHQDEGVALRLYS